MLWLAWFDLRWNKPDRTDNYLMQLACEIRRLGMKDPNDIQPNDMKLTFLFERVERDEEGNIIENPDKPRKRVKFRDLPPEDRMAISKGAWLGMMGGRYRVAPPPTDNGSQT